MKFIITLLLVGIFLNSCKQQTGTKENNNRSDSDKHSQSANFSDSERQEKLKKIFPLIDNMYKETALQDHYPGLAFGIVMDGKLVYAGNFGYTDISAKTLVSSSSLFRIASMSKSFTAMAILKLRDEGKLSLDDPAEKYVPAMKKLKYPTKDAPLITIRHLLTHGAGFPEDNPWGDRQLADSDDELIALLEKQVSFSNPPGIQFEYSNLGFAILGRIITVVSGKSFQQYIRENIWQPLGMNTSEWEYANVAPGKLAHGYRWLNETWNEETLLHDKVNGSWGAMGGMISSVDEFSKYMALHLSAWPPSDTIDDGPIKRSSVREMHHPWRFTGMNLNYKYSDERSCPVVSAYCYGLGWLRDCEGRVYISHSGGLPGFGSQWRIMPDYGIGVVALANCTYANLGPVNMRVLDTLIKLAGLHPREMPSSSILEQRKSELVQLLPDWKNAQQSGIFSENFFPDYPIDTLKKYAQELYMKAGKIRNITKVKAQNLLRGTFLLEGENADIEIFFTLSPENPALIQEYHITEVAKKQ